MADSSTSPILEPSSNSGLGLKSLSERQKLLLSVFEEQESTKQELDNALKKLEKVENDMKILKKDYKFLEQQNETLKKDLHQNQEQHKKLKIDHDEMVQLNTELQDYNLKTTEKRLKEISELSKKIQDLTEEKEKMTDDFKIEKDQILANFEAEKQKIQGDFMVKFEAKVKKVEELNSIIKVMEKNNTDLRNCNTKLKQDMNDLQTKRNDEKAHLENENRSRQKKMYELYEKINQLSTSENELKVKLDSDSNLRSEIQSLQTRINALEESLKFETATSAKFEEKCAKMQQENLNFELQNDILKKDLEDEVKSKVSFKESLKKAHLDIRNLQKQNSDLQKAIEDLKSDKTLQSTELIDDLKCQISNLEAKNDVQDKLIKELEHEKKQLLRSFKNENKEKVKILSDDKKKLEESLEFANSEVARLNNHLQVIFSLKKEQDNQMAKLCLSTLSLTEKEKLYYEWKIKEFEIQLDHVKKCDENCATKKVEVESQETQTDCLPSTFEKECSYESTSAATVYERNTRTESAESENDDTHLHLDLETENKKLKEENEVLNKILKSAYYYMNSKRCINCIERPKSSIQFEPISEVSSSLSTPAPGMTPPCSLPLAQEPRPVSVPSRFQFMPMYSSMTDALSSSKLPTVPLKPTMNPANVPIMSSNVQESPKTFLIEPSRDAAQSCRDALTTRKRLSDPVEELQMPPTKFFCSNLNKNFEKFRTMTEALLKSNGSIE